MNNLKDIGTIDNVQAMPSGEGLDCLELALFHDTDEECLGLIRLSRERSIGLLQDMLSAVATLWPADFDKLDLKKPGQSG